MASLSFQPCATAGTILWPNGTWLTNPGPQNYAGTGFSLAFGTAYFSPVLLPANHQVTKLAVNQLTGGVNAGSKIRMCLYGSNGHGLPNTLTVDGGEVLLQPGVGLVSIIANFPAVMTAEESLYWVMVQTAQPISNLFLEGLVSQGSDDSALSAQLFTATVFGYTYTAPMTYGACPAKSPVVSQTTTNGTLSTWVGH